VRAVSGYTSTTDITDADLDSILDVARRWVLDEFYEYEYNEEPVNVDGNLIIADGQNKTFYVRNPPIGDYNADDVVDASDVSAFSVDEDGVRQSVTVVVADSVLGKLTLTKDGTNPIDANNKVFVSYHHPKKQFPVEKLRDAIVYFSCHLVELRVTTPDRITLRDLERNRAIIMAMPTRFLGLYDKIIRQLQRPRMASV